MQGCASRLFGLLGLAMTACAAATPELPPGTPREAHSEAPRVEAPGPHSGPETSDAVPGHGAGSAPTCDPPAAGSSPAIPEIRNGAVTAVLADDDGSVFVAGTFDRVAGTPVDGLAHVLADGSVAPTPWHARVDRACQGYGCIDESILSMVRVGRTLHVGGTFVSIAGVERKYLAAFDIDTGAMLPWNPRGAVTESDRGQSTSCTFGGGDFGDRHLATDGEHIFSAFCSLSAFDPITGERSSGFEPPMTAKFDGVEYTFDNLVVAGDVLWVFGSPLLWVPDRPGDYQNGRRASCPNGFPLDRRSGAIVEGCCVW